MKKFLHRIVRRTGGRDTGTAAINGTGNTLDNVIVGNGLIGGIWEEAANDDMWREIA